MEGNQFKIENDFYVSEIGNYNNKDMLITQYNECGKPKISKGIKNEGPDHFYIKYLVYK